jgi:tRNA-binding protein
MADDPLNNARLPIISFEDFLKVDIRLGTIIDVKVFEEAKKAAYQLWIEFGEPLGVKKSTAQDAQNYDLGE